MPRPSSTGIRGLYRDAEKRYRIDLRYTDRAGVEQRWKETLPLGTPAAAAKEHARQILARSVEGTLRARGDEAPVTFAAAFDRYLEWCRVNGRLGSDPLYKERHRDRLVETLGKDKPLASISEDDVERHKKRRIDAGKAPGTVNRELVTLKHFLNRAVEREWIEKRPKILLLDEPPGRVRWLLDDERARLAEALAKSQRASIRRVVSGALLSGQRLSNVIKLRKADVDLKDRTLTLPRTKSGKRHHVPINDALAAVLKEAMAESKGDFVFVTYRGAKKAPYTRSGVSTFFARIVEEAKIEDFTFHDLRHDFSTTIRRAGHGLDVIQKLLGHASPLMTQRYSHLGQAALSSAVSNVVALVAPALPPGKGRATTKRHKTSRSATRRRAS